MSYPRNAASPPVVIIGVVVQISDGAVQTSGASVRVKTGSGSWGAGSGTLACDTTSWIWTYAPTQGETDATDFHVAVYKTGCIPCGQSIITSASATAGYAGIDWAKILTPSSTVNLSGTTVRTLTDAPADSSGVTTLLSRVTAAVALNSDVTSATYGLASIKTLLDAITGYIDTEVAAIKAKTDNLPASPAATGDIPSASTIATQVNSTLSTSHGSGSWESSGGGTGAYTRTFTVNDGTTALENATIRVTNGAESYSQQTSASGVAVFALDAATWSVAITKPGYTFTPTTLTVSATGSTTYSITQVSIGPPAGADFSTGSIICYDEDGNEASGVALTIEIVVGPGTDGWALSTASVTITSNGSGVASFSGFMRGGTYKITRGDGESRTFVVPDADSFDIAEVMGSE